ncbi:AAA family ATPase [Xanthomonas sp. 3498]|uniref:ATP-dependent nuclease n=1 Tax=Xanthomonas sp. 3498 TaxID=2663863 RepID=UPI0016161964|nr:AAA family ATPase [Xanthomonas sp. 3498]MBB5876292.1 putative ATP-dependent endonuclease of OLD family [Xanthomonas sp. 3498]
MYVHRMFAENFRVFADSASKKHLDLQLAQGLNVLVGENDAGKTCIVDVMRYTLLTTSNDFIRIEDDDFHCGPAGQASELRLELELRGLNKPQQAALLDWLTLEAGSEPFVVIHVHAKRRLPGAANARQLTPIISVTCGKGGGGPELSAAARDLLRSTYLKPLRDAIAELRPRKGSRLSQILRSHKDLKKEGENKFDKKDPDAPPNTLVGIMAQAQHRISTKAVVKDVRDKLNNEYLKELSFQATPLTSDIRISSELTLTQILERLELRLLPPQASTHETNCERGLGYNNVLFMAAELLLLGNGSSEDLPLLLIEEPEAHLHPQLQSRVLSMLAAKASADGIQVVVTTHSPSIAASAPVESLTIICGGKAFRLAKGETALEPDDYEFLRRFLDSSKANLFFARGVMIVEGPAEAILLPALAEAAGRSFEANGISVVSVGSVGLFRYARILQRRDGTSLPIKVACLGDADIVPNDVTYIQGRLEKEAGGNHTTQGGKRHPKRKVADYTAIELAAARQAKVDRARGGSTEVFISDYWTLEYDLLRSGLARATYIAVQLDQAEGSKGHLTTEQYAATVNSAGEDFDQLKESNSSESIAATTYETLHSKSASKAVVAQYLARLLKDGHAGNQEQILKALPPYILAAFDYLVPDEL